MDSLDISNNTTQFGLSQIVEWRDMGIGLAIIQLLSGVKLAGDGCTRQIELCLEGGLAVDCYVFPGNDGLPLTTKQRLALVPADARTSVRQVWADVEKAYYGFPTQAQVAGVHADCDVWAPWQRCGDYSALWVAQATGWLPWPWPTRKQWLVNVLNSGASNFGGTFAGTNNHVMTQYHEDVTLAGVSGIDRSLLSDTESQAVLQWLGGPMAINVGQGMQQQMATANDAPLCDHVFFQQTDDDGKTYDVEKCFGSRGLYISSNASGQWVNAGPM